MSDFSLHMLWTPAPTGEDCLYTFTVTNAGGTPLSRFSLGWSGSGRIDPQAAVENGILVRHVSNFAEVAAPAGFTLAPGESWIFTVRNRTRALRHWTDAAQAAFLVEDNGRIHPVAVGVCRSATQPEGVPILGIDPPGPEAALEAGLALVPWPARLSVEGTQPVADGLDLEAGSPATVAAADAFAELAATLFPGDRLLSAGGHRVRFEIDAALPAEAYRLTIAEGATTVAASGTSGYLYGLVTLGQMVIGVRRDPARCRFPARGRIEDAPAFGWRGTHLDVARQFYPVAELRAFLAVMAWTKATPKNYRSIFLVRGAMV